MSVVVLASDCESTWIVVRALREQYDVSAVVLESPESRKKFLNRRIKRLGWFTVAGQVLFQLATPLLRRTAVSARQEILSVNNWDTSRPDDIQCHEVRSANQPRVRELLSELHPSVIVINGTRILGRKLLESTDAPMINMHAGITPMYRGVHGGYWALAKGDRKNAGVTVHLVDAGIDTGDVLYQDTFDATEADNFTTYPLLQIQVGLPLLMRAVGDALEGSLQPQSMPGQSQLYYHPTIWQYVWTRFWSRVR